MGEDCDLTAYRLRLLIEIVAEGNIRYWENQWKSAEKFEGIESQALCRRAAVQCNQATALFPKKTFPLSENISPLNTRGDRGSGSRPKSNKAETQKWTSSKETTRSELHSQKKDKKNQKKPKKQPTRRQEVTSRGARRLSHSSAEHAGTTSQSWGGAQRQAVSKKHMR